MTGIVAAPSGTTPVADARRRPPAWRVAAALARFEGRRLLLPVGVAAVLALVMFGLPWPEVQDFRLVGPGLAFNLLPLAATALVVSNLAALRPRRHDAEELYRAMPAGAEIQTRGLLLSAAWPAGIGVAVTGVLVAMYMLASEHFGRLDLAELAVGPTIVAGASVLGVLLARWVRSTLVAPVALAVIAAVQVEMAKTIHLAAGWRRLSFWTYPGDLPFALLPPREARLHLVYLGGLVAMAAVGALAAHGLRRSTVVSGVGALAVVATMVAVLAPAPAAPTWAAIDSFVSEPADHQRCETRGDVEYCAYRDYRSLVAFWRRPVEGVRGAVPAGAWPGLSVHQRVAPGDRFYVEQEALADVLPSLPPRYGVTPGSGILTAMSWSTAGDAEFELALQVAARAVGLPVAPADESGTVCDAAGQGRAMIALWLAAQATPGAAGNLRRVVDDASAVGGGTHLRLAEDGVRTGARWGVVEARAAMDLLDRPRSDVARLLEAAWLDLTAPSATTARVGTGLGLDVAGSGAGAGAAAGTPCR